MGLLGGDQPSRGTSGGGRYLGLSWQTRSCFQISVYVTVRLGLLQGHSYGARASQWYKLLFWKGPRGLHATSDGRGGAFRRPGHHCCCSRLREAAFPRREAHAERRARSLRRSLGTRRRWETGQEFRYVSRSSGRGGRKTRFNTARPWGTHGRHPAVCKGTVRGPGFVGSRPPHSRRPPGCSRRAPPWASPMSKGVEGPAWTSVQVPVSFLGARGGD